MEFIISESPKMIDGLWNIAGRCSSTIFRGGRFTKCVPYKVDRNSKNETVTTYSTAREVNLVVEKIIAYKHELDVLDSGMTALLLLSGDASTVAVGTLLR